VGSNIESRVVCHDHPREELDPARCEGIEFLDIPVVSDIVWHLALILGPIFENFILNLEVKRWPCEFSAPQSLRTQYPKGFLPAVGFGQCSPKYVYDLRDGLREIVAREQRVYLELEREVWIHPLRQPARSCRHPH
jgi:hypothetical protein